MDSFEFVDTRHYFKVYFLNMMVHQLPFLSLEDQIALQTKCVSLFKSLYKLFKIQFLEDKYLELFEDVFDLDNLNHLSHLENTIMQEEAN
jgi:hypothetical protein